jgi:hypothetical protein
MLREEERPRLELRHDPIAREDAGDDAVDLVAAAHHQPVPPALVARLRVVAPVRLRVDVRERSRPVVVAHVRDAEVRIELGDDRVQLHERESTRAP